MHIIKHAVILFADCRGFTSWAQSNDAFHYLEEFLTASYGHVLTVFEGAFIKTLGDGAMIIHECPVPVTADEVTALLGDVLMKIRDVERRFRMTCDLFTIQHGHNTALQLGWGIVRGIVNVLSREQSIIDYIGTNINKTARLCSLARPAGVVIDREDFPDLPSMPDGATPFVAASHFVHGITEALPVWMALTPDPRALPGGL